MDRIQMTQHILSRATNHVDLKLMRDCIDFLLNTEATSKLPNWHPDKPSKHFRDVVPTPDIFDACQRGKIAGIKELRTVYSGIGLVDAKNIIESWEACGLVKITYNR